MTEDDRQRLRREAVEYANGSHASLAEEQCILAMESLLVEAEGRTASEAYDAQVYDEARDAWKARAIKAEATIAQLREEVDCSDSHLLDAVRDAGACRGRAERAEATIAEQAKENERLRSFVARCAEGDHPDEIPEEAQEMLK